MLQVHSTQRLDQIESSLRLAAERHGGSLLAASNVGRLIQGEESLKGVDAISFTLCFSHLYAALLRADIRFAAFLPVHVVVCAPGDGVFLEALSPREYCRMLHRPEAEPLAASLEDALLAVMEEAAHPRPDLSEHRATEEMVNMRAALAQRIDCHGTKVEELAGTGVHDSQGG